MIPVAFDYVRAKTVREVLNALSTGEVKLLAGGHSLIPLMRFRLAQPAKLIDIGGLTELQGIDVKGKGLRIGAATTYRDILDSGAVKERAPLLAEATQLRSAGSWVWFRLMV